MSVKDLIESTRLYSLSLAYPKIGFRCWHKFCFKAIYGILQVKTSSYYHKSNGQMDAGIKFVKCTIKKCRQTNNDVHFALLQIRSILVGTGLPSAASLLFNRPIRALLLQIGKEPINVNNDDESYEALKSRQEAYTKNNDTHKDSTFFSAGSTVAVQREDGSPWMHGMIMECNSNADCKQSF